MPTSKNNMRKTIALILLLLLVGMHDDKHMFVASFISTSQPARAKTNIFGCRSSIKSGFKKGLSKLKIPLKQLYHNSIGRENTNRLGLFKSPKHRKDVTAANHFALTHEEISIATSPQHVTSRLSMDHVRDASSYGSISTRIYSEAALLMQPEINTIVSPASTEPLNSLNDTDDLEKSLYQVLPIPTDRKLTKLEVEFREMLQHFADYKPRDILSLRDPRMRLVFEGVASSATCAEVYRAFEVLYEDLYPLRVAGRLIYARLKQLMIDSRREWQEEVDTVVAATGLDVKDVEDTRLAFVSVAAKMNGDSFLTRAQLKETGLADTVVRVLGFESVDYFLDRLSSVTEVDQNRFVFTQLMIGLENISEEVCSIEKCNPAEVMQDIMLELREKPPDAYQDLDEKRQRFSQRYDEMVEAFKQWENLIPEGSGRRLDVVRGCFVGAKNQPVVDALRIVYVDYSMLRVAGDTIFKLVSTVMNRVLENKKRKQRG
jgi:hypothetical protein